MKDEDSEDDGEVRCPYCESTGGCDHLPFLFDATLGETMAGVVDRSEREGMTAKAFVTANKEGTTPDWHDPEIGELFDRVDETYTAEVLASEEPWLPDLVAIRVLIELLEDTGGREGAGGISMKSGGRCESAVRAMYAKRSNVASPRGVTSCRWSCGVRDRTPPAPLDGGERPAVADPRGGARPRLGCRPPHRARRARGTKGLPVVRHGRHRPVLRPGAWALRIPTASLPSRRCSWCGPWSSTTRSSRPTSWNTTPSWTTPTKPRACCWTD